MKLHILLVEDNLSDVYLVRMALRNWKSPYELHVSPTVADAIAFINRTGDHKRAITPHLALVDINLPDGLGFSVIKEIKDSVEFRSIAVITMSTSTAESDIRTAIQLHSNAYITKPSGWKAVETLFESLESFWRLDARFEMRDPLRI